MSASPLPLDGLRVVEFASFVAGPSAGMTLAQLGAEVIRIDPLGGNSDYRRWPVDTGSEHSLYWTSLNRGKRSIAVDVRSPAGQELVVALATAPGPDAGIFVDNNVGRRWLSHEALADRRADMITVHVEGHADGRGAVDYTVNAAVGVPELTGPPDAGPVNHVLPAWDLIAGQSVTTALLSAVYRRLRTGAGSKIDVALADVAAAGVANLGWLTEVVQRGDRARHGNYLYGSFGVDALTSDGGRVYVVALTPRQWRNLVETTGTAAACAALAESLAADFSTDEGRYVHREAIAAVLRPWFQARPAQQVHRALDAGGVLWGPYRSMAEFVDAVRADPASAPVLAELDQPGIGAVVSAHAPIRVDNEYAGVAPARELGSDTDEVLASVLGLSDAELGRLRADGVI
ncbi:CoA transferase [Gordonia crocea]|uniref:2-methylfumaryl-CoA isomerase n=1 Tax=Gordonia crocea TaxID=589162 RepID=A0A7M3STU8_9ACTN|nr:CoA transferase [Gordonia crocea]GED96072.1 2-methylfumaryl-CoA isomerase [Gordonia crocea]